MKRKLLFSGVNEWPSNGIRLRLKRVGKSMVDFLNDLDGMIDSARVLGER